MKWFWVNFKESLNSQTVLLQQRWAKILRRSTDNTTWAMKCTWLCSWSIKKWQSAPEISILWLDIMSFAASQCINLQSLNSSVAFRILERCSGSVMFSSFRWDSFSPAKSSRVWKPCMDSKELSSCNMRENKVYISAIRQRWPSQQLLCSFPHHQADAVQDFLQGFGFGFGSVGFSAAAFPPGRGAFVGQEVHINELKGAHLVVELPGPGAHGGLLDDVDDVPFLWKERALILAAWQEIKETHKRQNYEFKLKSMIISKFRSISDQKAIQWFKIMITSVKALKIWVYKYFKNPVKQTFLITHHCINCTEIIFYQRG